MSNSSEAVARAQPVSLPPSSPLSTPSSRPPVLDFHTMFSHFLSRITFPALNSTLTPTFSSILPTQIPLTGTPSTRPN